MVDFTKGDCIRCVDESSMIRDFVSFHFVFPTDHLYKNGIKSTKEVLDIVSWE